MRRCGRAYIAALVFALVLVSASCGGGTPAPAVTSASAAVSSPAQTSVISETSADDTEDTEPEPDAGGLEEADPPRADSQEPGSQSEGSSVSDQMPDETETSGEETESPETEATSVSEETAAASEPAAASETSVSAAETTTETTASTTTAAAAETSATTATTTTATTTTTTTTTTAAAAAEPAEPSPPQISKVSSPGTSVFTSDTAVFDYSNCGSGYVSVDYKGNTRLKMLLKKSDSQFDFDIYPAKGAQYFTLAQGSGSYTVEIYEMVDGGKFIKLLGEEFKAKIADETAMFTYRNQFVNFDANSKCVAKASEVCAGCTSNIEKIAAVFKFVTDNITYDKALAASVTSGYIPDPDSVLAKKKGICFDYASLTAAMLRSQGVPTRLIIGYASPNIYHAWNEVYTPEKGWIAAEIMLDGTGFRRIDATFYASASDKQNFADYIAKSGNYSNVYIY